MPLNAVASQNGVLPGKRRAAIDNSVTAEQDADPNACQSREGHGRDRACENAISGLGCEPRLTPAVVHRHAATPNPLIRA